MREKGPSVLLNVVDWNLLLDGPLFINNTTILERRTSYFFCKHQSIINILLKIEEVYIEEFCEIRNLYNIVTFIVSIIYAYISLFT